ncbi:hypothetical protein FOYG_07615 [Fusarium oxysporum NRRL 32931]|uniref:Mid2 domain-containing protein n=1 Tax=Fusarium oxysporum NRRL 32931 TaxID=660029 RepID=W9I5U7_FUSOX|nr:hypothetical protein FOYG_07615 [Fusarium oxysporum NRRL 32931]
MIIISILTLILSIFANLVLCRIKFLRPPQWNTDVDLKTGFGENIGYEVGDTIQLLWETDLDKIELLLIQTKGSFSSIRILDSSRTEWKAEWDVAGILVGNEDSVYCFALDDPEEFGGDYVETQYFNVTAPKPKTSTTTVIALRTSTITQGMSSSRVETSTTQPLPTSTTTDQGLNPDGGPGSDSGISKGKIAGAAVGGTVGGLVLLGTVGWLVWSRLFRDKRDRDISVVSESQQQRFHSSETKAELPGDQAVEIYSSGYARSPPGLHEAP